MSEGTGDLGEGRGVLCLRRSLASWQRLRYGGGVFSTIDKGRLSFPSGIADSCMYYVNVISN